MKKYWGILLFFIVCIPVQMNAFPLLNDSASTEKWKLRTTKLEQPQVIPTSPDVNALLRFGEYPTDLSTGMVDISVPIWELTQGSIKVPINIGFHASGRRVEDIGGTLGLGWTLKGGGLISRKVKGEPDDIHIPWVPVNNNEVPSYETFYGSNSPYMGPGHTYNEGQYDIFTYVLPSGTSGKFIWKDVNGKKEAMTIPYNPVKIELPEGFGKQGFRCRSMKITDTDGTQYLFGDESDWKKFTETGELRSYWGAEFISVWHLNRIISPSQVDTVYFEYEKKVGGKHTIFSDYNVVNDQVEYLSRMTSIDEYPFLGWFLNMLQDGGFFCNVKSPETLPGVDLYSSSVTELKSIKSKGTTILFNYEKKQPGVINIKNDLLNEIIVKNSNGEEVKRFKFDLSPGRQVATLGGSVVYFLDAMSVKSNDGTSVEKYKFDYYSRDGLLSTSGKDWWGYYNGADNVNAKSLIPDIEININKPFLPNKSNVSGTMHIGRSSVTRAVREESMKNSMLRTIHYPTGGSTEFFYEANTFFNIYKARLDTCGGLRIKQIINNDAFGKKEYKTYEYPQKGGILSKEFYPGITFKDSKVIYFHIDDPDENCRFAYRERIYNSDFPSEYYDFKSNIIYYPSVTEYLGTKENNSGYTSYEFYGSQDWDHGEYHDPDYSDLYYLSYIYNYDIPEPEKRTYQNGNMAWRKNNLKSKSFTPKSGNGGYSVEYKYEDLKKDEVKMFLFDRYVKFTAMNANPTERTDEWLKLREKIWIGENPRIFSFARYKIVSAVERLKEEKVTQDGVITIKQISYNNVNCRPNREQTTNSNGISSETRYFYPSDYSTQSPYREMVGLHILNPVIEQQYYYNGVLKSKEKTNYTLYHNRFYLPSSRQYKTSKGSDETRSYYDYNDKANLRYVYNDGYDKSVYLWGYNNQYPIAAISNADYSDITRYIPESTLNSIAGKSSLSTSDLSLINSLRDKLPNSQVTTYTYLPLRGIETETSPRKVTTTYRYDSFGRLISVLDHDKQVLQQYEYNYKSK